LTPFLLYYDAVKFGDQRSKKKWKREDNNNKKKNSMVIIIKDRIIKMHLYTEKNI
jgi:hypothetical protein